MNVSVKIEGLPESFVSEKAPRTAIALDTNGTLSLIEVTQQDSTVQHYSFYTFCCCLH